MIDKILEIAKEVGVCAVDLEHSPDYNWRDEDFADNFWGAGISVYDGEKFISEYMTDRDDVQKCITFLTENQIGVVGHYFHNDILMMLGAGFELEQDFKVIDTSLAYNLLFDEWDDSQLGLKALSRTVLDKERADFIVSSSHGKDSEEFKKYAIEDVEDQLKLWQLAEPKLEELGLIEVHSNIV